MATAVYKVAWRTDFHDRIVSCLHYNSCHLDSEHDFRSCYGNIAKVANKSSFQNCTKKRVSFGLKSNHKGSGTSMKITSGTGFSPCVASLNSCVIHSRVTHRYHKDRTAEKREKKETVLQSRTALTRTITLDKRYMISGDPFVWLPTGHKKSAVLRVTDQ